MRKIRRPRLVAMVAAAVLACTLSACGLNAGSAVPGQVYPGSIKPVPALEGVSITIGSKDFSDNINIAYIMIYALEAAGMDVKDLTDIQGSNSARTALETGQIDAYPEYTGTSWINYNGHTRPIVDPTQMFQAVKKQDHKQGITWADMAPANNTYAMAVGQKAEQQYHFKTLSDMAKFAKQHPKQATVCLETEFASRADGWPGMTKKYGIDIPRSNIQILGTGPVYSATGAGQCMFGEVFTTDGRIQSQHLTVLDDNEHFFPKYNVSLTIRNEMYDKYPQIAQVLKPVMDKITNKVMIQLNSDADVKGQDWSLIARRWLAKNGFVTLPKGTLSQG